MPTAVIFFTLVCLAIVVGVVFAARHERNRAEAIGRLAETMGLMFQPKAELDAVRALGDVQLFERGRSRRAKNVMTGRIGDRQAAVFDYWFTTGGGKSQQTHSQTVVLLPGAKPSYPDMQMAPENPLIRIAEVFGYQDIDLDSHPEFSRRYLVRGADPDAIRAALYPTAASYFAEHEGWTVEVKSGHVAIYRANDRPKPEDLPMFIENACAAVRQL
jgi:hypothetical protein